MLHRRATSPDRFCLAQVRKLITLSNCFPRGTPGIDAVDGAAKFALGAVSAKARPVFAGCLVFDPQSSIAHELQKPVNLQERFRASDHDTGTCP